MARSKSGKSTGSGRAFEHPSRGGEATVGCGEPLPSEAREANDVPTPDRPFALDFSVTLTARAQPEEDGGYSAEVPSLLGCFTEADTLEALRVDLIEAVEGWLLAKQDLEALRVQATNEGRA